MPALFNLLSDSTCDFSVEDSTRMDVTILPFTYTEAGKADGGFHIVEQKPRFATTMGSVVVDRRLHVLDALGRPIPGLYAAGEVLDVDAQTGGFNLQIAWSTGHLAGTSV